MVKEKSGSFGFRNLLLIYMCKSKTLPVDMSMVISKTYRHYPLQCPHWLSSALKVPLIFIVFNVTLLNFVSQIWGSEKEMSSIAIIDYRRHEIPEIESKKIVQQPIRKSLSLNELNLLVEHVYRDLIIKQYWSWLIVGITRFKNFMLPMVKIISL